MAITIGTPTLRLLQKGPFTRLTRMPCPGHAYALIQRRAQAVGNHTFQVTGITAYVKNSGTIDKAAVMANHSSTCATQLYDRRSDAVTLDEVERVLI